MLGLLRVLMVIFYCFFCKYAAWAVIAVCRARVLWGKGKSHCLVSPHSPAPLYNLCLQQAVQTPVRDGFHALSPLQDGRFPKGPILQGEDHVQAFRRKDSCKAPSSSLTTNEKRKEFDPQTEHWCHLKAGRLNVPESAQLRAPSPLSSLKEGAPSPPQKQHSLGYCHTHL